MILPQHYIAYLCVHSRAILLYLRGEREMRRDVSWWEQLIYKYVTFFLFIFLPLALLLAKYVLKQYWNQDLCDVTKGTDLNHQIESTLTVFIFLLVLLRWQYVCVCVNTHLFICFFKPSVGSRCPPPPHHEINLCGCERSKVFASGRTSTDMTPASTSSCCSTRVRSPLFRLQVWQKHSLPSQVCV